MADWFYDVRVQMLQIFFDPIQNDQTVSTVRRLVSNVRKSLSPPDCKAGVWEMMELDYADYMLDSGFVKLALAAVDKAVAVHHLSFNEYSLGFDSAFQSKIDFINRTKYKNDASDYGDKIIDNLAHTNQDIARAVESREIEFAHELNKSQQESALELVNDNKSDAEALVLTQADNLQRYKDIETKRLEHQEKQAQIMSWITGSYSFQESNPDFSSDNVYIALTREQKIAAIELKKRQDVKANALKNSQYQTAVALKNIQKMEADKLKDKQDTVSLDVKKLSKPLPQKTIKKKD
jgi:hypothetical protein